MAQITLTRAQATQLVVAASKTKEKTYFIAKDQGAYLGAGEKKDQVLFYFRGCEPEKDTDWYENSVSLFGGDDFGEMLSIEMVEKLLKNKDIVSITWKIGKTQVKLIGNPGKQPPLVKKDPTPKPDHSEANKIIDAAIEAEKAIGKAKTKKDTIEATTNKINDKLIAEPKVKPKSIKEIACELLCVVETTSDEGRSIGMSYEQVLARILELRPGAKTSLNCLRWYAGKIRVLADGYFQYKLPQLRMRPVSGKHTAGEVPAVIVTDEA